MIRTYSMAAVIVSSLSWAQEVPVIKAAPVWSAPVPQEKTLASGAKAWILNKRGVPLVHVALVANAGSYADPVGKEGLAALTATLMTEAGAGVRKPAEVLEAFEALGTELNVSTTGDGAIFGFSVLSTRLNEALALATDILSKPTFDAGAFESIKQRRVAELVAMGDEPTQVAMAQLMKSLYGGHLALGIASQVQTITLDDVKAFYMAHYASTDCRFILVGDIDAETAKSKIDAVSAKAWLKASPTGTPHQVAKPVTTVGIDRPGAAQTVLLLGRAGVGSKAEGYPALRQIATVLGGSFTSRLVQNLREKHGYTYGVRAQAIGEKSDGILMVQTSVRTDVTAEALEQLMLELNTIANVSQAEIDKSRALAMATLVQGFGSGAQASYAFAQSALSDLSADWLSKAGQRNEAVKLAAAQAASKQFGADGFTLVVVGDRKAIERKLKEKAPTRPITWVSP
jgi:zinc protease